MKITKETKFNIGQTVYVVWENTVVPTTVNEIFLDGKHKDIFLSYSVLGKFNSVLGNLAEWMVCEREIFGTEQEALVYRNDCLKNAIKREILSAKQRISQVMRSRRISDCGDDEKLKEALRLLRTTNEKLAKILKVNK